MKEILKKIAYVGIFTILFLQMFYTLTNVLTYKTSADIDLYNCKHFYENEENSIDVICFGSSHCFCTINNAVLFEDYGIASYNFSAGCQNIGSTYYYMKESLETQNPKVMLVELYAVANPGMQQGDVYRNTLTLEYGQNYFENVDYIYNLTNGLGGQKSDLILKWPIIHTRYNELRELDYNDFLYFQRGYRSSFVATSFAVPEACHENGITEVSEDSRYYLDKMIELAKSNNIEIIFYIAPYILDVEEQKIYNGVQKYLEERGQIFFNFSTDSNIADINYATDMWERGHLNVYGAEKVSAFLAEYMIENYTLEDRRADEAYKMWKEDVDYFKRCKQAAFLNRSMNSEEYFQNLSSLDNLCVITFEGNKEQYLSQYVPSLQMLGVSDKVLRENDVFIFYNKKLVGAINYYDENYYQEYNGTTVVIEKDDSGRLFDVNIGEKLSRKVAEGVNIYVYNEISGSIVDVVGFDVKGAIYR